MWFRPKKEFEYRGVLPIKAPTLEELSDPNNGLDWAEADKRYDILVSLITSTLKDDKRIQEGWAIIGTHEGNYALYIFKDDKQAFRFYDKMPDVHATHCPMPLGSQGYKVSFAA